MRPSWLDLHREARAAGKRWDLVQALAYIGTGDLGLVQEVRCLVPPDNALPDDRSGMATYIYVARELEKRKDEAGCLAMEDATRALLEGLKAGDITAYVDLRPTLLTGMEFREIVCKADMYGLAPRPRNDDRYWGSVDVNAEDVKRLCQARVTSVKHTASMAVPTGSKRGPRPKWDWLNMMGELVRIADQDGLDSLGSGQAPVERWASEWLAQNAGLVDGPAESLVREHIAPIFKAIDKHNLSKSGRPS